MEIISLKEVSKSFGKNKVLDKINFSIEKGEIMGIVGPSGEGKSVLIKIILRFLNPDKGEKTFFVPKTKIGFSMQNNSLYENLHVEQNIKYFAKIYGVGRKERKEFIPRLIKFLELENFKKTLTKNLSGGTKKRLDIACALVNKPKVLVLDEPFLGLDPERIKNLLKILLEINKEGTTLIISSHRIKELSLICKRIALIKNKQLKMIDKKDLNRVYKRW